MLGRSPASRRLSDCSTMMRSASMRDPCSHSSASPAPPPPSHPTFSSTNCASFKDISRAKTLLGWFICCAKSKALSAKRHSDAQDWALASQSGWSNPQDHQAPAQARQGRAYDPKPRICNRVYRISAGDGRALHVSSWTACIRRTCVQPSAPREPGRCKADAGQGTSTS